MKWTEGQFLGPPTEALWISLAGNYTRLRDPQCGRDTGDHFGQHQQRPSFFWHDFWLGGSLALSLLKTTSYPVFQMRYIPNILLVSVNVLIRCSAFPRWIALGSDVESRNGVYRQEKKSLVSNWARPAGKRDQEMSITSLVSCKLSVNISLDHAILNIYLFLNWR